MKKKLLILPAVLFLSASCAAYQPAPNGTQPPVSHSPVPASTTLSAPSQTRPASAVVSGTLDVTALLNNKDAYAGKTLKVEGKIEVSVLHYAIACPQGTTSCDTTQSGGVNLWDSTATVGKGVNNNIRVYKNGQLYPCTRAGFEKFACPPFTDRATTTLEGVWVKTQVPDAWIGGSGGGSPKPTHRTDFYYLEVQ